MKTSEYRGLDCFGLENERIKLLVPQSIGPRVISLSLKGGENLFAELPDALTERPDGESYHFYGGHRLWVAPEDPLGTYSLDDNPVFVSSSNGSLFVRKQVEVENGIEKTIQIHLATDKPVLTLVHSLKNQGDEPLKIAPWAITQLKPGGIALLPQAQAPTGLLPNRLLALWPYSDLASTKVKMGNRFLLVNANMPSPYKIGFPNLRGWLAYWRNGVLFVKKAPYESSEEYPDKGCSSECYCNQQFLELETIGPLKVLSPGDSLTHQEKWEIYTDIPKPENEEIVQTIADEIGLE